MGGTEATIMRTTATIENVDGGVSFTDLVARATTAVFEGYGRQELLTIEAMARRKVCTSIYISVRFITTYTDHSWLLLLFPLAS